MRRPGAALAILVVLAALMLLRLPGSGANWTASATNGGNSWSAVTSFPSYTSLVAASAPWSYYRMEDTPSATGSSSTTDSSGNGQTGTYVAPTTGPWTWYKFDGGTPRTADNSGAGNDALLYGGATYVSGMNGSALSLAQASPPAAYAVARRRAVATTTSFSVFAWVYVTGGSGNRTIASQVSGAGTPHQSGFVLRLTSAGFWQFALPRTDTTSATVDTATSTTAAPVNQWVHVAGIYDASAGQISVWIDGRQESASITSHTTVWDATGPLQVGRSYVNDAWGEGWNGSIDDLQVYQKAISGSDLRTYYGDTAATRWDFSQGTGTAATDNGLLGLNNTGTLGATTTWVTGRDGTGYAVALDGSATGYVNGTYAAVDTTAAFSVSAWVKLTSTGNQALVSQNGMANAGFFLGVSGGRFVFSMARSDSSGATVDTATSAATVTTGVWTNLVGIFDAAAGTLVIYVANSASTAATHTTTFSATGTLQVGRSVLGSYTNFLNGSVDDVRVLRWPLTSFDVSNLYNSTGGSPGANGVPPAMALGMPGALVNSTTVAVAFGGGGTSIVDYNYVSAAPLAISVECWVRATGTNGGELGGFTTTTSGTSSGTTDRVLYLDSAARVSFGVITTGGNVTLRSPAALNDGAWHYVAGTAGPAGITLYVDGVAVDSSAGATLTAYGGYWRFGAAYLGAWPNRPARDYLIGSLDEMAVYTRQLTASEISEHFHGNR